METHDWALKVVDFKPFGASVLKDLRAQLVYQ